MLRALSGKWRGPEALLIVMAVIMPLGFSTWRVLLNNFAVENVGFTGIEIGILQSLREIPGFLAFAVVFLLLIFREQTLALVALCILGVGTALAGLLPTVVGLYATTIIMSTGFHYFETVRQSLTLQWVDKAKTPYFMGKLIAVGSLSSLVAFALIYLGLDVAGLSMVTVYLAGGGLTLLFAIAAWIVFPSFPSKVEQRRGLFLKKRYWLFYALTFMSGARRQIFIVFASFLLVEKFGFSAASITLMFLVNGAINIFFAPMIGRLIGKWGERPALILEYAGLIGVFTAYALVDEAWLVVVLYILDHLLFGVSIALKTYFQKIADPGDIAASISVGFTINHIAAVVIPVAFGFLWLVSPPAVFLAGAAMAGLSLGLAWMIPGAPGPGNVSTLGWTGASSSAQ